MTIGKCVRSSVQRFGKCERGVDEKQVVTDTGRVDTVLRGEEGRER